MTTVTSKPKRAQPPAGQGGSARARAPIGWLIGVLTAAVAIGVGEFVAVFVRPAAAPVIAVGNRLITLTPESAKREGIRSAGTNDKLYLILGIYLLLALFGAIIGELALRRLRYGLIGVGVVGVFGVYCALTANASRASDIVPTVIGTFVAMGVLTLLLRAARERPATAKKPAAALADRRLFLQASAGAAALAALAGFGGRAAQHARFDVAGDRAKVKLPPVAKGATNPAKSLAVPRGVDLGKSGVPWRTPNNDFYRIDTALTVPQIAPDSWQLKLHGMVDRPISISYKELLARPQVQKWITLNCVSNEVGGNLISNSLFEGALLADLLREAGISPACDQLLMSSSDGMTIGAPTKVVMDGRAALLAVGMNGQPLPLEHGFPVRVVVPGLYGYVSACKWVVDIEATTFAQHAAYWVQGGWAADPAIKMSSRIDRPSSGEVLSVGDVTAVAGVAWDQHVGIAKVEVQINDGPWKLARLAAVPSVDTWQQWVYPWTPEQSGAYTLRVRATDKSGQVQDSTVRDVFPSGSTGYDSVAVHANI